ncbi:MAG: hypothetical protein L6R41_004402 [Letrouitia leprolyta]|nr:MAG: hypothetical protein L6R41_004402 [Letrouitia leprolyta]
MTPTLGTTTDTTIVSVLLRLIPPSFVVSLPLTAGRGADKEDLGRTGDGIFVAEELVEVWSDLESVEDDSLSGVVGVAANKIDAEGDEMLVESEDRRRGEDKVESTL